MFDTNTLYHEQKTNARVTMRQATKRSTQVSQQGRTFRSGPYLEAVFTAGGRVDAYTERQICARIKQARIEAGMTQKDLAGYLDVEIKTVQNYERNRVPFRRLEEIAKLTRVSHDWLLRGAPQTPANQELSADVLDALAGLQDSQESVHGKLDQILRRLKELEDVRSRHAGSPGN